MDIQRRKSSVALLSVVSNSTLVVLKLTVGIVIGSVSVISEAIHSGVDLLASLIAWFAVSTSGKPADREHPYGHGKIENISGTVEAMLIFLAAAWIVYEAAKKLLHPEPMREAGLGMAVMLISAVANIIVSRKLFRVGKETDSVALQADAWHLKTDVYTSGGVMIGLAVIWLGRIILPGMNLQWIDPAAAILVAMLIVKAAYHLTMQSARDLLDVSLPPEEETAICDCILNLERGVRGIRGLRTRKAGAHRFVDIEMLVSSDMTVEESHRITDAIEARIQQHYPGCTVTAHVEPCSGNCDGTCPVGCLVSQQSRSSSQL